MAGVSLPGVGTSLIDGGGPGFGTMSLLWQLLGADMNTLADQKFTKNFQFNQFFIPTGGIICTKASGALSGALGGIYPAASKGGSPLVAATQAYAGLTTTTSLLVLTPTALGSTLLSPTDLYLSLSTALGSAGSANFYIWGMAIN